MPSKKPTKKLVRDYANANKEELVTLSMAFDMLSTYEIKIEISMINGKNNRDQKQNGKEGEKTLVNFT